MRPTPQAAPTSSRGSDASGASRSAPPASGELLGRYRIVGDAGKGGMGTVSEAVDTLLNRRVAIKFLTVFEGEAARERVIREARAMASLRHRSICRVLEVVLDAPAGTPAGSWRPFMVMEWIDGATLASAWPLLPLEKRLASFESVVEAVASMHAVGVVHRDLKPANILLDSEDNPIVVDFGLSARRGEEDAPGGTPGWSAPEQFEANADIGPSADVFALGALLYNLLTGTLPFDAPTTGEVIRRAREGDVALPEAIVPGLAPALQRIALAAIDPDPAQRYADASALLADLRRFHAGESVLARPRQLFTRFADEVERHLADTERWRKQGLASEQEVQPIIDGLRVLQRPESPWVLDSRRLSASQVSLYLGGWLVVLALTVGVWNTSELWRDKGAALPWLVPAVLAGLVTAVGFVLSAIGEQRTALGFLFTSTIAAPTALWQFMRTTGILEDNSGSGRMLPSSAGLSDNQQLAIAVFGLAIALAYRLRTPSAAFTLVATVYGLWASFAVGLRYFDFEDSAERVVFGQMAGWMLLTCAPLFLAGIRLDERSNRPARDLLVVSGPRDGSPVVIAALLGVVLMLATLANQVPEWLWFGASPVDQEGRVLRARAEDRALAFLLVGAGIFALSAWLRRRPTPLRDWCARALRWIVPSFMLIPIVWLEIDGSAPGWGFWIVVLALVSVGFVAASAILQWRPFLVSGLLGTADFI
ncbi:MAG: Serine/threonine-protein kinase PknB, partial [Planctomycetota bacterium]